MMPIDPGWVQITWEPYAMTFADPKAVEED